MHSISDILEELNLENGSNYKLAVLKKYQDNDLLKRVLKMAYDKVTFTYGITMRNVRYTPEAIHSTGYGNSLTDALDSLVDDFCSRIVTGNDAINRLSMLLETISKEDAQIIEKILGRDLKINMGRTNINKVFKDLIIKPFYMRCDTYSSKTAKNISFPAFVQLKADGMAIFSIITENGVECFTRSGENFKLETLQYLSKNINLIDTVIQGEFLFEDIVERSLGNGKINSLIKFKQGVNNTLTPKEAEKIENDIVYQIWDCIPLIEYMTNGGKTIYQDRFEKLLQIF